MGLIGLSDPLWRGQYRECSSSLWRSRRWRLPMPPQPTALISSQRNQDRTCPSLFLFVRTFSYFFLPSPTFSYFLLPSPYFLKLSRAFSNFLEPSLTFSDFLEPSRTFLEPPRTFRIIQKRQKASQNTFKWYWQILKKYEKIEKVRKGRKLEKWSVVFSSEKKYLFFWGAGW